MADEWADFPVVAAGGATGKDQWADFPVVQATPVTIGGLAKAAGSGVVKGGLGIAGLLMESQPALASLKRMGAMDAGEKLITDQLHQPQNRAERYAETAGEFIPGMVGPGGVARQVLNLGKGALAGLATEGAGHAAEGTGYEKAARIGTALASPLLLTRGIGRAEKPVSPSREELYSAADEGYDRFRKSGAEYSLGGVASMAAKSADKFSNDFGITERVAPDVHGVLKDLQNAPSGAKSVTAAGLETARRELGNIAQKASKRPDGGPESLAARMAADDIGAFIERANPLDVVPGLGKTALEGQTAAESAARAIGPARGNYAAASRSETIGAKDYNAELQTDAAHSGANADNALRQNIKQLLRKDNRGKSPAQRAGFSEDEIAALEAFVKGGVTRNTLRTASNMMGGGKGLGAALYGMAGAGMGGAEGIGLATVPVIGALLKSGQNALAQRAIDAIDEAVRLRSPLASKKLAALPPDLYRDIVNALRTSAGAIPNQ